MNIEIYHFSCFTQYELSTSGALESFPLSANRVVALFSRSFWDNSSICLKVLRWPLRKIAANIDWCTYLTNLARRVVSSGSLSTTAVVMICLNLSSCGMSPSIFSLTSWNSCQFSCYLCAIVPTVQAARYLVMLDERVYPSEGSLERRGPVRGFFCNIEEDLHAVCDSLPLRWER